MTVLAVFAVSLCVGTWAGIRIGEASARIDLASYLLATIPKGDDR